MTPDTWHLTPDTWHLTPDTWHVSRYMWHMTYDTWWGWTFCQNVSFLAVKVWEWQCLEDSEQKDQQMNDEGVIEQSRLHRVC